MLLTSPRGGDMLPLFWEGVDGEGVELGGLLRPGAMSFMCVLSLEILTPADFSLEWS